ncbi:hypothetical protein PHYSODRAFT_347941 [Phytophthora sojae]|uniref:FYVE-type domain-containing protein n=1 Tax=Phytophthora sojae (strain P6497) TaxID=1094619 RepID=G5A645_PHYSP|nr:hypothetical protein PHYSODRAFT_347941 [Phytophthora sojae]EGZ08800.1 hypothetical protein PHYSODRAFT_347941 [Phytophthora sojae]|eukprot:XP_009535433.1 hypothetical protein PHYSODRAFT_347941 [Phytophthora sojae]
MGKGRFIVNPFPELHVTPHDQRQLQDLANNLIMSNLDKYNKFVSSDKGKVDPNRWKSIKEREQLKGKVDDLVHGVMSEDLERMRIKASYVDDDPFQSLIVKWMELDIPFASMNLVKNRDYVYLEGTGFVTSQKGDRLGYHLLHSVSFPQTHDLPNRIRGNVSIIAFWRQAGANAMEMYATGIFDPCGDMIRMLVVPGMASAFLSSVKYSYCGQMRKLSFMLDKAYTESKQRGAPNKKKVCVTCSSPITTRRLGDLAKSNSSCKMCFSHVCYACKVTRKLSFVDSDLMLSKRKVTFCTACISSVTSMSARDCARAKMLSQKSAIDYASIQSSSTGSAEYASEMSYSSS